MKVMFENHGDEAGWVAWIEGNEEFKGVVVGAETKAEAWREMMISIQVKLAYDSGISAQELKRFNEPELV